MPSYILFTFVEFGSTLPRGAKERLPRNAIDCLIDKLGGPDGVAEMTGRRSPIVRSETNASQFLYS